MLNQIYDSDRVRRTVGQDVAGIHSARWRVASVYDGLPAIGPVVGIGDQTIHAAPDGRYRGVGAEIVPRRQ